MTTKLAELQEYVGVQGRTRRPSAALGRALDTRAGKAPVATSKARIDYTVPGIVPALRQPTGSTCWATVAAMMISWRHARSLPIEEALATIGRRYVDLFRADRGLSAEEKPAFLATAGLAAEWPQSQSAEGWEAMLRRYGPLWVTSDEQPGDGFAIHARVMTAIRGDGLGGGTTVEFVDPLDGGRHSESLATFVRKFEEETRDTGATRIQIVHWPSDAGFAVQQRLLSQLAMQPVAAFSASIPLAPDTGGRSIGPDALETGDIIVSTTTHPASVGIRVGTGSAISHSMIYVGDGQVVEAIGTGVVMRPLADALADSTVAVAFRHPSLTPEQALKVRDYAVRQIGRKYDYIGVARHVPFRLSDLRYCRWLPESARRKCREWVGRIYLGTRTNDEFFCSELVLAAFADAGVPLTTTPPHWNDPQQIVELQLAGNLEYVGHLKTDR